jgi:hypothetical protein
MTVTNEFSVSAIEKDLKDAMELVVRVIVQEKGKAWSDLPY